MRPFGTRCFFQVIQVIKRRPAVAVLLAILQSNLAVAQSQRQVVVSWKELGPLVENRQFEAVLVNGVHVQGKAWKVLPHALTADIQETSDPAAIRMGVYRIPRELFSTIRVQWVKGFGRFLVSAIGFVGSSFATWRRPVPVAGAASITVLATIGGYYAGKEMDTRRLRVVILDPVEKDLPRVSTVLDAVIPTKGEPVGGCAWLQKTSRARGLNPGPRLCLTINQWLTAASTRTPALTSQKVQSPRTTAHARQHFRRQHQSAGQ